MKLKTVYMEQFSTDLDYPTMVWNRDIDKGDIAEVFQELRSILDQKDRPTEVVVLLNGRVNFPISATTTGAFPVHKHRNLKAWLVVDTDNSLARVIANVLSIMGKDNKIIWFKSKGEVRQYLLEQNSVSSYANDSENRERVCDN